MRDTSPPVDQQESPGFTSCCHLMYIVLCIFIIILLSPPGCYKNKVSVVVIILIYFNFLTLVKCYFNINLHILP